MVTVVARVRGSRQQLFYSDIGRPYCQVNSVTHAVVSLMLFGLGGGARGEIGGKAEGDGRPAWCWAARAERYVQRVLRGAAHAARGVGSWQGELHEINV